MVQVRFFKLFLFLRINIVTIFSLFSMKLDTIPPYILIDSLGQLGIGMVNPEEKVDVNGNVNINGNLLFNYNAGDSAAVLVSKGANFPPVWDSNFKKGLWTELENKIYYSEKNVELRKTLINIGDYSIDSNQTYFNIWNPNLELENHHPPFHFTGASFPNPDPLTQPSNFAYNFGSNLNPGGGSWISNKPAYGIGFENQFYIDGKPFNEFHVLAVDTFGIQRRPIYSLFAFDGSRVEMTNQLSRLSLHDKNNTKQLYSIDTDGEIWSYNGNGLRHIFNKSGYAPIWQKISEDGTVLPLIGYYNNILQLGSKDERTNIKIGNTTKIGFTLPNIHYVSPSEEENSGIFKFSNDTQKFNTIDISTIESEILKLSNNEYPLGRNIIIDSLGNFKISELGSNPNGFVIGSNLPENSFSLNSNGNLSLGIKDDTEKLVINGNIKLLGNINLNGTYGNENDVLTSLGNGLLPVWRKNISSRYEEMFVASQNQEIFNLNITIESVQGNLIPIEVFRNGLKLKYSDSTAIGRNFMYMGNQVILSPCLAGDEIEIIYFK